MLANLITLFDKVEMRQPLVNIFLDLPRGIAHAAMVQHPDGGVILVGGNYVQRYSLSGMRGGSKLSTADDDGNCLPNGDMIPVKLLNYEPRDQEIG